MNSLRFLLSKLTPRLKITIAAASLLGALGHILSIASILFALLSLTRQIPLAIGLSLCLACGLFRGMLGYGEQYLNHFTAFTILKEIRTQIFTTLEKLAPARLEDNKEGDLISSVTDDIETLEVFYAHTLSPLNIAIGTLLFTFLVDLFLSSWILALAYLGAFIFIGFIIPLATYPLLKSSGAQYRNSFAHLSTEFLEDIEGASAIVFNRAEEEREASLAKETTRLIDLALITRDRTSLIDRVTALLLSLGCIGITALGAGLLTTGTITTAQMVVGIGISISSFIPALSLSRLPSNLTQTFASCRRMQRLMNEKPLIEEVTQGETITQADRIALNHVDFEYESSPILKDINLDLNRPGLISLSGRSGSGKSTLVKLLLRHRDPSRGTISVDGIDMRSINSRSLHDQIISMNQTTHLFNETIRENMQEAAPEATDQEIREALKRASVLAFVESLPAGLDTIISLDATNISTGQRQRFGLARVFLRQPSCLILDEPTSNVDMYNERAMMRSIVEYSKQACVFLISHSQQVLDCAPEKIQLSHGHLEKID